VAQPEPNDAGEPSVGRRSDAGAHDLDAEQLSLYRIVVQSAYGSLRGLVKRETAAEVAHDVGINFWRAWVIEPDRFRDPVRLEKWVTISVRCRLIDRARVAGRQRLEDEPEPSHLEASEPDDESQLLRIEAPAWETPDQVYEHTELKRVIGETLGRMTYEKQQVYIRLHVYGETVAEAARQMDVAESTVRYHLAGMLPVLRDALVNELGYWPLRGVRKPAAGSGSDVESNSGEDT